MQCIQAGEQPFPVRHTAERRNRCLRPAASGQSTKTAPLATATHA
jgi:hypothetical protein